MSKIIHYRNKCIGCGICFELQPDLWRISRKDGKAYLLNSIDKKDVFQRSIKASDVLTRFVATSCPTRAIKIDG